MKAARPLPGGIHPEEHKAQSLRGPIEIAPLPSHLVIPVTQPGFTPPEILVQPGDRVLKGQLIARGAQGAGLPVHASSSGKVEAVGERAVPNASLLPEPCVTIVTDGEDCWIPHEGVADYRRLPPAELVELIREAGIAGLGGAGFPTYVKLRQDARRIDTLIINACECEPFITADDALMRERADGVMAGIEILLHILKPQRCLIGIEDNKPEARAALQAQVKDARVEIVSVPARYPSGAERQLVWILTGIELPAGTLPTESGIVCQNVGTAHAIARAVLHGEPLLSRIATFTGAALREPGNLEARIGTPIDFLLAHRGLRQDLLSRLIMGGSLMGQALPHAALPVTKTCNCVIATTEAELPAPAPPAPCIRCGLCAQACPVRLLPQQLYWFTRSREHDKAVAHKLFDCIECGACAYVCPSRIPLVQYYRAGKAEIREEQARHLRGEHSRERFEFHQRRIEQEKARAEARRRERAEQARQKAGKPDAQAHAKSAIQAALARVKAKKAEREKDQT